MGATTGRAHYYLHNLRYTNEYMNANPFESHWRKFEEPVETRESLLEQLSNLRPKHAELLRTLAKADEQYAGKVLSEKETQARVRAQNLLLTDIQIIAEQISDIENKVTQLSPLNVNNGLQQNTRDVWSDPGHRGGDNRAANA